MRAAIYLRVSTDDQTTENQRSGLVDLVQRRGWTLVGTYVDHGISGATAGNKRPAFNRLLNDVKSGKVNGIVAWSIDRLGRSIVDLHNTLAIVHQSNANIILKDGELDTTTPNGELMFGIMALFANFERRIIKERVNAGIARARAQGKKLGRPAISGAKLEKVDTLITTTALPWDEIARMTGASQSFVEKRARITPLDDMPLRNMKRRSA